jgi:DNA-directed RNA polymerase specialized sigma24 family protein
VAPPLPGDDRRWASFPATRRSVLVSLQSGEGEERRRASDLVSRIYWEPVYRHLRLRWRKPPDESCDLTQEFFAMALEKECLATYEEEKGRFRAFLKTCLDRFVQNVDKAARRFKRGGSRPARVDLDAIEADMQLVDLGSNDVATKTPEELYAGEFDRAFAASLLDAAVQDLERSLAEKGKRVHYQLFARYVLADESERPTYGALASELGLKETDVTNYLALARRELRRILLENLRALTSSEEEFQLEARSVLGIEGAS